MRRPTTALGLVFAVLSSAFCPAADPPSEVRKQLDGWYKYVDSDHDEKSSPPWEPLVEQLESEQPAERKAATERLISLLSLALADEESRWAEWHSVVGGIEDSSTRLVRDKILRRCVNLKLSDGAFPLIAWYCEHDSDLHSQRRAAQHLHHFSTPNANALRLKLANGGHANAEVVVEALGQLPGHKQKLPDDQLLQLCHHHRRKVREAARELYKKETGEAPAVFDPMKAWESAPMKANVAEIVKFLPEIPAKDATLVAVTIRSVDEEKVERMQRTGYGWLIDEKADKVTILRTDGKTKHYTPNEKTGLNVWNRNDRGGGWIQVPVTELVTVAPTDAKTIVKKLTQERRDLDHPRPDDAEHVLPYVNDKMGRGDILLSAAMFSAWLIQAGKHAEAAELFLSEFDTDPEARETGDRHISDRVVIDGVRAEVGDLIGTQMYEAFAFDRDFASALKFAKFLDSHCPHTSYHGDAQLFVVELPKRMDDFTKFKLPTPAEWKELKAKLSRDDQIDYLASRFRLLTGFAFWHADNYRFDGPQYTDPKLAYQTPRPSEEKLRQSEAINPLIELWEMKLTLKDTPTLSKHLKDDWHLLAGFNNIRARTTRVLIAGTIDELALHKLYTDDWEKIDAEIERINKWAKAHEAMPTVDLQWELYQQEKKLTWFETVKRRIEKLLDDKALSKERRAEIVVDMKRRYEQGDGWELHLLLELFQKYEPKAGLKFAEERMDGKAGSDLYLAARIVFAAGDKAKARPILGEDLTTARSCWRAKDSLKLLLDDGTKESLAEAVKLFGNRAALEDWPTIEEPTRPQLLAQCVKLGMSEPHRYYREQLDDKKAAEKFADEIAKEFAKDDPDVKKVVTDHPKAEDQIPHLKKWLDGKLKK